MKKYYSILLLTLLSVPAISLAFSPQELSCFEAVDAQDFIAPVVKPRMKLYRGLRGCKNRSCLLERVRPSRKVLQVVVAKNLPREKANVNFGNLGWARQNLAVVSSDTDSQIPDALLIARGVDNTDVSLPRAAQDLIEHDIYVAEIKCVRKAGFKERSFNEVQNIL